MSSTLFLFCVWLLWASAWVGLLGFGALLVIGISKAWRWIRAWRRERLLRNAIEDRRIARAMKRLQRMDMMPDDYKRRLARFNMDTHL